jgi:hypothetical protein
MIDLDDLRATDLQHVLAGLYAAIEVRGSTPKNGLYRLPDGRKIAIKGDSAIWCISGSGTGGIGAIDLVAAIDSLPLKIAIKKLAAFAGSNPLPSKPVRFVRRSAPREVPVPSEKHWPIARNYLTLTRALPGKLVDYLHDQGLVYADSFPNVIFKRPGGCDIRGTSGSFHGVIGDRENSGPFVIPGDGDVFFTESAIDAASVRSVTPDAHVISLGGRMFGLDHPGVQLSFPTSRPFRVFYAFDQDLAGDDYAHAVLAAHPSAQPFFPPPEVKDWNKAIQLDQGLIHSDWR